MNEELKQKVLEILLQMFSAARGAESESKTPSVAPTRGASEGK